MALYLVLMLAAGTFMAIQSPVNAALSRHTGSIEASLVSFLTGTVVLLVSCLIFGKGSALRAVEAPVWQWLGGTLGACVVCSAIVSVPRIGVLSASVAMILGNLAMAAVIDNYGWFDAPVQHFTLRRMLGFVLVIAGLYFISSKR